MDCQEAKIYFDLPDDPTLKAHLTTCPRCAQDFEQWQTMDRMLAELPQASAPADLFDSIMSVVEAAPASIRPEGFDWLGFGGIVLSAALLTAFFIEHLPADLTTNGLQSFWSLAQNQLLDFTLQLPIQAIAQGLLWSLVGLAIAYAFQEGAEIVLAA